MSVALSAPETQKATLLSSSHFARSDFEPVQAHKAWFLRKACEQRLWRKDAQGKITKGIPENSCKYVSISNHLLFQALLTWLRSASLWNLAAAVQQHLVTATEPHGGTQVTHHSSLDDAIWCGCCIWGQENMNQNRKNHKNNGKKTWKHMEKNMKELWTENLPGPWLCKVGARKLRSWVGVVLPRRLVICY